MQSFTSSQMGLLRDTAGLQVAASTHWCLSCASARPLPFPHQLLQAAHRGLACASRSLAGPVFFNRQSLRLRPKDITLNTTSHRHYLLHVAEYVYITPCRYQPACLLAGLAIQALQAVQRSV